MLSPEAGTCTALVELLPITVYSQSVAGMLRFFQGCGNLRIGLSEKSDMHLITSICY